MYSCRWPCSKINSQLCKLWWASSSNSSSGSSTTTTPATCPHINSSRRRLHHHNRLQPKQRMQQQLLPHCHHHHHRYHTQLSPHQAFQAQHKERPHQQRPRSPSPLCRPHHRLSSHLAALPLGLTLTLTPLTAHSSPHKMKCCSTTTTMGTTMTYLHGPASQVGLQSPPRSPHHQRRSDTHRPRRG